MRAIVRGSAAFLVLAACSGLAMAVTNTFTNGGTDGKWSTLANWSTGAKPTVSTPIVFGDSTPATVTMDAAGGGHGTLITKSGDILFVKATGGASLGQDGNDNLTIAPADGLAHTYTWGDGTNNPTCPQVNNGDGFHDPVWDIGGASKFVVNVQFNTGATSTFTKNGTGTLQLGNNFTTSAPSLLMPPVFNLNAGVIDSQCNYYSYLSASATNGSILNIASGAILQCELDSNLTGNGGKPITFAGNGKIVMNKKLDLTGTKYNLLTYASVFAPGTDGTAGLFTVNGNVKFQLNGTNYNSLKIDITGAGTTPGVDFDQLSTDSTITTLNNCDLIVNATGAVAGNSYTFLTAGASLAAATFHTVTVNNTALPYTVVPLSGSALGYQITFTPEPCTLGLLGIGSLIAIRRRAA